MISVSIWYVTDGIGHFFHILLLLLVVLFRSTTRCPQRCRHPVFNDKHRLGSARFFFLLWKCVISFIKFNKLPSFGAHHPPSLQTTNTTCCSRNREHYSKCIERNTRKSLDTQILDFFFLFFILSFVEVSSHLWWFGSLTGEWGECIECWTRSENVNYQNAGQTLSGVASGVCSLCARFLTKWEHKIPWSTAHSLTHDTNSNLFFAVLLHNSFLYVFGLSNILYVCGYLLVLSLHLKIQSTPYTLLVRPRLSTLDYVCWFASLLQCHFDFDGFFFSFFIVLFFFIGTQRYPLPLVARHHSHNHDLQFKCISLVVFVWKLIRKKEKRKRKKKKKTINRFYWRWSRRQDNCFIVLNLLCDAYEMRLSRRHTVHRYKPCAVFQSTVYLLWRSHPHVEWWWCVVVCGSIVAMQSINFRFFFPSIKHD